MRHYTSLASVGLCLFLCSCKGGNPVTPASPLIQTQPLSQTVAIGIAATFSVAASGSGPLKYQWIEMVKACGEPISTFTSIVQGSTAGI